MIRSCIAILGAGMFLASPLHAADARFDAFMGRVVGNSTTVGFGTGGTALATSSAGLGTPGLGSMGASQAGTGVRLAGNVAVPLGNTGKAAAAVASAGASRAAFLRGLAAVAGPPGGMLALSLAAPAVVDWIDSSGKFKWDKGAGVFQAIDPDWTISDGMQYRVEGESGAYHLSSQAACQATAGVFPGRIMVAQTSPRLLCVAYNPGDPHDGFHGISRNMQAMPSACPAGQYVLGAACSAVPGVLPASMDDIAQYMDKPEAPALTPQAFVQGVAKAGIDPFGGEAPAVSLTGPATVPGQKTETSTQTRVIPGTTTEVGTGYSGETHPATRTSTQTATHNVTYNDNRVTYNTTNTTTTTVTNNVTGQSNTSTGESTTEDDAPDDSVTDTALGDIPKLYERKYPDGMVGIWNDKKAAMQGTSLMAFLGSVMPTGFNTGTCPAWSISVNFGGVMNMGVHPIEVPCWLWGVVKAALIVSALLYARRLIFGG